MTINDITPLCRKCRHSTWQVRTNKNGETRRVLFCELNSIVQPDAFCPSDKSEPSEAIVSYFNGTMDKSIAGKFGAMLQERYRRGNL